MSTRKGKHSEVGLRRPLAVALLALLGLAALPPLRTPAVASSRASGHVVARGWFPPDPYKRAAG